MGWHLCSHCRTARPDDELLAYWPVRDPSHVRYVCRPGLTDSSGTTQGRCFREKVRSRDTDAIATASSLQGTAA